MKGRERRRRPEGTATGAACTMLVHGAAALFVIAVVAPPEVSPPVYAIELVAAPLPSPNRRVAPEALPPAAEPEPEPPAPVEEPEPDPAEETVPVDKPKPKPEPEREQPPVTTPAETQRDPSPPTSVPEAPAPGETPSTGRDATTIKTPGLDFPFPEYLRNIANQIYRRWKRPTGNSRMRAEIFFLIHRDGSVSGLRFVQRSGSFSYDLEAQGAIENAGNSKAFGVLPDGWTDDVLPISFYFEPRPN